jgi:HAMP domain-containing protein
MSWLLRKIDSLAGTIVAATAGLAASQAQAFSAAYLQRLGGHIDEARLTLQKISAGDYAGTMPAETQAALVAAAGRRLDDLVGAYDAIMSADPLWRPLALLRDMDEAIAKAAFANFQPALPLDMASLISALAGMALGWLVYQLVTAPLRWLRPRRPAY